MLGPHITPGITILEPGPGMGYFTLPMARMVGPEGRVVAVEREPKMLRVLERRARRAGVGERIHTRQCTGDSLAIDDLAASIDLVATIHMVHEVPDQQSFFAQMYGALKPGGTLLVIEPPGHVTAEKLAQEVRIARDAGFEDAPLAGSRFKRGAVLRRSAP
jgi:ubiquinone/menaquinone biosynthesis C-methylase UbiE